MITIIGSTKFKGLDVHAFSLAFQSNEKVVIQVYKNHESGHNIYMTGSECSSEAEAMKAIEAIVKNDSNHGVNKILDKALETEKKDKSLDN